ncbi:MAG TPA: BTAD domain-containing putative transcriptional regulator, partial [Gemmatimonadaceae bacterium]
MSSPWQLRTLGGLTLLRDGVAVSGAPAQRRRLALLAIIAAAGDRGYSREKLLAMLWPESDAESARHALSQLLFVVKRDLQCGELFMGGAELRLNPRELSSDVAELDRHVLGKDDAAAVALYGGPFLDGFHLRAGPEFERWQEEQRARLAKTYARALERLAAAAEARGDLLDAVGSRRRLAATDPLNTRLALALMRSLAASGDVAGALQHARLHETLLREELGVEADPAVVAFAAELRRRSADIETPRDTGPTRQSLGAEPASPSAVVLPAVTPVASRKRRSWLVGLAATIVAAIGVGALLASSRTSVHLDRNLIAVAPFEVLDPELTIWREGMMDVVSR